MTAHPIPSRLSRYTSPVESTIPSNITSRKGVFDRPAQTVPLLARRREQCNAGRAEELRWQHASITSPGKGAAHGKRAPSHWQPQRARGSRLEAEQMAAASRPLVSSAWQRRISAAAAAAAPPQNAGFAPTSLSCLPFKGYHRAARRRRDSASGARQGQLGRGTEICLLARSIPGLEVGRPPRGVLEFAMYAFRQLNLDLI